MLTQEKLDKIFAALRIAHKSHWKAPKLELVLQEIERKSAYVFRAGANPWVAEIKITDESVTYTVNPELPERMRKATEELKRKFEEQLRNIYK